MLIDIDVFVRLDKCYLHLYNLDHMSEVCTCQQLIIAGSRSNMRTRPYHG